MDEDGEDTVSTEVARPHAAWLEDLADETGHSPEEVLDRLLSVVRSAEEDGAEPVDPERVDALERRLEAVADDLDANVQDLRNRVVQVKREADEKAPADHDHADLRKRVAAAEAATTAEGAVDSLHARLDSLQETTRKGFGNYEDVLKYLTDETESLDRKVQTLASAVVDVRDDVESMAAVDGRRRAVEQLALAANREGIRTADCEECGATVDVALLTEPACPHCQRTFDGVEPARGFFGSATLTTGDPPALDAGEEAPGRANVEEIAEESLQTDAPTPDVSPTWGADDGDGDDARASEGRTDESSAEDESSANETADQRPQ